MTSRNLFFKLMREDIRRRLWAITAVMLAWFFIFPVRIALIPGSYSYLEDKALAQQRIILRAEHWFQMDNTMVCAMMLIGAVILGISSFSYLHSKRKVDFYHSIPVRRELLFFVNYVDGILLMFVPYIINALVGAGMAMTFGASPMLILGHIGKTFLFHLVYYVLIYSTVVVAMMLTGNIFLGILGLGVFFSYAPMVIVLMEGLYSLFETHISESPFSWGLYLSPVTAYMRAVGNLQSQVDATGVSIPLLLVGELLQVLAIALLLMGAALWLYQKRPSEAAGKAMAFPLSRTPIKVLLVVVGSLYGGMIFYSIRDTLPWVLFGLVFFGVFLHCLIEILYHFDFRKLFVHIGHMAVCVGVSVFIFLGFYMDFTGYDTYLPKAEAVESSYVSIGVKNEWVEYSILERTKYSEDSVLSYTWRNGRNGYVKENMVLTGEDSNLVLDMARKGIESLDDETRENSVYFVVGYRMNSGKEIERRYVAPFASIENDWKQLMDSTSYKEGNYPIFSQKSEDVLAMYGTFYEGRKRGNQEITPEKFEEVLEAYRNDLRAFSVSEQKEEEVIGRLYYVPVKDLGDREAMWREIRKSNSYEDRALQNLSTRLDFGSPYPIYPSFTNTLSALADCGITPEEEIWTPDTCAIAIWYSEKEKEQVIQKAEELKHKEHVSVNLYLEEGRIEYTYKEPNDVASLYDASVLRRYADMNMRSQTGSYMNDIYVTFEKTGEIANEGAYRLVTSRVPNFLLEDMIERANETEVFEETAERVVVRESVWID